MNMDPIKEALTFDDVTLAPKYSDILPSEVDTSIILSKFLKLRIPLLTSAMDTITESKMAIAIAKAGGIGIIHRNLNIKKQVQEIKKVKKQNLLVGAAVGAGSNELARAKAILKEGINMIVVDTAHGHTKKVSEMIKFIKKEKNSKTALCAGNIATAEAARYLDKLGVDIIKVGIGPGSICTTRLVAGIGVPQLTAILNVRNAIKKSKVKIISDGGIKYSGDLAKAFAAGADFVMLGGMLAGHDESGGEIIQGDDGVEYKSFYGMSSAKAMERHYGEIAGHRAPEGKEVRVPYRGPLETTVKSILGGLRSACSYVGARRIKDLPKCTTFIRVSMTTNEVFKRFNVE